MSDFEDGRRIGQTGGWDPNANTAGQLEGQRQRAEEEAAWKSRFSWSGGGGVNTGTGGGVGLLLLLVLGGVLFFMMRLYIISLVCSIAVVGVSLWGGLRLLGLANSGARPVRSAALAYGIAIVVSIWALVGANLLSRIGLDLTPGLEIFPPNGGSPTALGLQSIAFPVIAGLAAGTWWLNRSLPSTRFPQPIRWGALFLLLGIAPLIGVRLARMFLDLF